MKQKINKVTLITILSMLMIFILGMLTNVYGMRIGYNQSGIKINVTRGADNTGVHYNMEENPLGMFQEGIFCIQQGQTLHSWASRYYYKDYTTFTSTREATINGENTYWKCINGAQASVNTKESVKMAWIMCQTDDRSSVFSEFKYSEKQRAIYQHIATWCNAIGMATATNSGGYTSSWVNSAENYYNTWKNIPDNAYITNNTKDSNIEKETIIYNSEEYTKIGPFNLSFASTYSEKHVYNQDGIDITNYVKFGKYVGTTFNVYDNIKDASSSGKEFYLLVKTSSNASSVKLKATVSNSKEKLSAKIYILEAGNGRQNLMVGQGNRTYNNTTANIEMGPYEILGDLEIKKTDITTDKALANIGFTLKVKDGIKKGKYVGIDSQNNATYNDKEVHLKTDNNGKIKINKLIPGDYELVETINPYEGYEDVPATIKTIHVEPKSDNIENITNKREYITLSGYVWEDKAWSNGKEEYANELYKEPKDKLDTNDILVENIVVQLKNKEGNIIAKTITDKNGKYTFNKVEIDKLPNYYIEFVYNGMIYESVSVKGLDLNNATKAIEGTAREEFNKKYITITKGQANDENNNKTYNLKYQTGNYESKIQYEPKSQYEISANTYNAYNGNLDKIKTPEEIRKGGIAEITNINLGIKLREQPDLSVVKDIESAKVSINGAEHVYKYGDRFKNMSTNNDYTVEPTVKFGQKRGSQSYTRAVYASDVKYTGENKLEVKVTYKIGIRNNSTNLNAVVNDLNDYFDSKYDLVDVGTAINEDGSIKTKLEKPSVEKYDDNYQKITIKSNLQINAQKEGYVYVELKVKPEHIIDIIDNGQDVKLDNVTEIASYSIKDRNGNIYAGIDQDSQPENLDPNKIETFEDDTDKAPGLLICLQYSRKVKGKVFEDETNTNLAQGEVRQGSGAYETGEKGIKGVKVTLLNKDGTKAQIYNERTNKWENIEATTDENGEYTLAGFLPGEYKIMYTWGDGTYKVQDYKGTVVDETSYEAKETNEEWYKDEFKKNYDAEWDKTEEKEIRRSDAVDDYALRENIDNENKEITNATKAEIEKAYEQNTSEIITKMNSTTPVFKVNVEYETDKTDGVNEYELNSDETIKIENGYAVKKDQYKNTLSSIDFGIVERARQVLSLDKTITNAKLTLADGRTLIDAKINDNGQLEDQVKYLAYIPKSQAANGQVKIEIDDELIQSATLELTYGFKVTNISEIEYLTKNFYLYGKGYGEDQNKIVNLTPSMIIDYIDNNITTNLEQNQDWKLVEESRKIKMLNEEGLLENSTAMKNYLNSKEKIITSDKLSTTKLTPLEGNNTATITLKGYKLLANNTDETLLDNDAEIIKLERTGGSTLATIPGNYIPGVSEREYDDSNSESVTIVPPTGLNTNIISWTILLISSLGILVAGIILIKKYVLRK